MKTKMLIIVTSIVLFIRLIYPIIFHSVNIYYSDEWAINETFAHIKPVFQVALSQYNTMLQGPSYVLSYLLARFSNFDSRSENWLTAFQLFFACIISLRIIWNRYKSTLIDISIPLIFLSLRNFYIVSITSGAPYSSFPILLVVAFGWYCLQPWTVSRCIWSALIILSLLISGYGYVIVPFIILFLCIQMFWSKRKQEKRLIAMLLLGTIVTFSIFVYWYQSMLIRDGFAAEVLHASFKEICIYMIHFVGYYFFQTPHIPLYFLDVLTFISIVSIWLYTFIKYLKEKSNTLFIAFISMSYTMGFSVLNACARAIFGLEGVAAYRYASQFMLFMFGLFFVIKNIKKSRIKILCMVLLFTFLVWKEVHLQQDIINQILSGESIKNTLRLCIQEGHTIESCMDTEHWDPTIPDVPDDPKLSEFLNFLRLRKANVYAP